MAFNISWICSVILENCSVSIFKRSKLSKGPLRSKKYLSSESVFLSVPSTENINRVEICAFCFFLSLMRSHTKAQKKASNTCDLNRRWYIERRLTWSLQAIGLLKRCTWKIATGFLLTQFIWQILYLSICAAFKWAYLQLREGNSKLNIKTFKVIGKE